MWLDDGGKDRFDVVVGLLHPGGEVLAVGREERVGRTVAAPMSAACKRSERVPLTGMTTFGAGPVVVGQTPFLGAAGKSRMKTERGAATDGDGAVRAGGRIVRGHGVVAGADRGGFGGQAESVLVVVRRVEVHDGLHAGAVERIEEDASVVSGIEDGGDDVRIGIGRAKLAVGGHSRHGGVVVGSDGADEQREVVGAAGGADLVETMAVDPGPVRSLPTPGGVPVTEAAAMAIGCSGRIVADTAAETVGKSGPDGAVALDAQLVPIDEAAIRGAKSDAGEDVLQSSHIAVAQAWSLCLQAGKNVDTAEGPFFPFPGPLPRLRWGQWTRGKGPHCAGQAGHEVYEGSGTRGYRLARNRKGSRERDRSRGDRPTWWG